MMEVKSSQVKLRHPPLIVVQKLLVMMAIDASDSPHRLVPYLSDHTSDTTSERTSQMTAVCSY